MSPFQEVSEKNLKTVSELSDKIASLQEFNKEFLERLSLNQ